MKSAVSDYSAYRTECMRCAHDQRRFANFRQSPTLNQIWEHVTFEQGKQYHQIIAAHPYGNDMLERAKTNDLHGGPILYDFPGIGRWSPTTLRYVKVALDLYDMMGDLLFSCNIAEIGGGYGGQATVINSTGDYVIYDLPETCNLIYRYVNAVRPQNKNIFCMNSLRHTKDIEQPKYDLLISNYAWTELDRQVQNDYYNNVISKCDCGYITCNFISSVFGVDSMSKNDVLTLFGNKSYHLQPEQPLTHDGNFILLWTATS